MNRSEVEKREEGIVYGLEQFQKMVLGFMPGGHIIEGFLNYRSGLKQKRVLDFADKLKAVFEHHLGEEAGNYNFENEDFVDVFDSIINQVQQTKSEQKLNSFRAVLINSIRTESNLVQAFIDLVSKMDDVELDILNVFLKSENSRKDLVDEMYHLNRRQKEKQSYVEHLKSLARDGEIQPNQSIAEAQKNEVKVLAELVRAKNAYNDAISRMNGQRFGVSEGEYEYHLNNLVAFGLVKKIEIDPFDDGTKLDFCLVTNFGNDLIDFITI